MSGGHNRPGDDTKDRPKSFPSAETPNGEGIQRRGERR
jgi:hypothetical protein